MHRDGERGRHGDAPDAGRGETENEEEYPPEASDAPEAPDTLSLSVGAICIQLKLSPLAQPSAHFGTE